MYNNDNNNNNNNNIVPDYILIMMKKKTNVNESENWFIFFQAEKHWLTSVWRKKNTPYAYFLYDSNILTTTTVWSSLSLYSLLFLFIWHRDIRAEDVWHDP